jgi:hypothetical protein
MAPLFVNIVLLVLCLFLFFGLVNDPIAQQQGTRTVDESLEHHRDDSIPLGA